MKKLITLLFLFYTSTSFAQNETFDLITYNLPATWKKEINETSASYTFTDKQKSTWCRIFIVKSTVSRGSIEADFENEWQELIVKNYNPTDTPQINEINESGSWKIKSGAANFIFNKSDAMAMLSTMSGFERCVSIVAITNSKDYLPQIQSLLASVQLKKPDINPQQLPVTSNGSIVGTWTKSASDQSAYMVNNGVAGYIMRQYIFNKNGTYSHFIKTFSNFSDLLLTKESGTYQASGNSIIITPQKAVIEAWSKKNNSGDKWGSRKSSQNATLEKTTYQFTIEYNTYIKETQLILQGGLATKRDGHFDQENRWYYKLPKHDYDFIKLPVE